MKASTNNFFVIIIFIVALFMPIVVKAQSEFQSPQVVINEVLTGIPGEATKEFVELYNLSEDPIDISNWKLSYTSASGVTTSTLFTFPVGTIIYSDGYLLLASRGYLAEESPKFEFNPGLSGVGGTVSLVTETQALHDRVGWGDDARTLREGELAPAPSAGQSIERLVVQDIPQDTNNNKADFSLQIIPSPRTDNTTPETPTKEPVPVEPAPEEAPPEDPVNEPDETEQDIPELTPEPAPALDEPALQLQINELFIDPASPLTDSNDEWVELYNPNSKAINLLGYKLFTGSNFTYSYTFTDAEEIMAGGYFTVSSGSTNITLSNSGGAAKLANTSGTVIDETMYDDAKEGYAWARDLNGSWVWTSTPTESAQNIVTIPAATAKSLVATAVATAAKKSTAKKSTTSPKPTAKKATAKAKATKVKAASNFSSTPELVDAPSPIPAWLLAAIGLIAVLYMGYEYRFELTNKLYQLRTNRANRR